MNKVFVFLIRKTARLNKVRLKHKKRKITHANENEKKNGDQYISVVNLIGFNENDRNHNKRKFIGFNGFKLIR